MTNAMKVGTGWLVAVGMVAVGCYLLAAESLAWGTVSVLVGVVVGSAVVRSPRTTVDPSTLTSALLIVSVSWLALAGATYGFADITVESLSAGSQHNLPKGAFMALCMALSAAGFGAFSIGLRRGLATWLR